MDLQEPLPPERVAPAQAEPTAPERAVSHAFQANPNNLDTEFRAILDEIRRARRKLSGGPPVVSPSALTAREGAALAVTLFLVQCSFDPTDFQSSSSDSD